MSVGSGILPLLTKGKLMYTLTTAYDGDKPIHTFQFSDALAAFTVFLDTKDWGFAKEYATYNLTMPSGKMYTRNFHRPTGK